MASSPKIDHCRRCGFSPPHAPLVSAKASCVVCGESSAFEYANSFEAGVRAGMLRAAQIANGMGELVYAPDVAEEIARRLEAGDEGQAPARGIAIRSFTSSPPCLGSPHCLSSEEMGVSHGIRCPRFSSDNALAWYKSEVAGLRERLRACGVHPDESEPDAHPHCEMFTRRKLEVLRDCESDGHYLCDECTRKRAETE